jgi:hypothetical protein
MSGAPGHGPGQDAERTYRLLAPAETTPLPMRPGLTAKRAEELISEIGADRDSR